MTESKSPATDVIVIGAGIVGVCSALYLQREGFRVTLLDRGGPGEGASAGNAGSLGVASIPPTSMPGLVRKLPRMLTDPLTPLAIRWGYLPRVTPWFLRFLRNSAPGRVEAIADARAALLRRIFEAYEPLLADAGARDLVRRSGKLLAYETADGLARNAFALDLRRRRGIAVRALSGDEAREMEPALSPNVKCAAFFPDVRTVVNPLRLVRTLAEHFARRGGTLKKETVTGFEIGADGPRRVVTDTARHDADRIVISAGAWSKRLAAELGSRLPLEAERGYHAMVVDAGARIGTSITSADRHVVLTPMEDGVRVSGIAQFAGLETPPDFGLVDRVLANARAVVPDLGGQVSSRWAGPRPSLPDSIPVIGPSPTFPKVFFAFGHDHIGLATGAITGKLIAELVAGRPTTVDVTPYRADRF